MNRYYLYIAMAGIASNAAYAIEDTQIPMEGSSTLSRSDVNAALATATANGELLGMQEANQHGGGPAYSTGGTPAAAKAARADPVPHRAVDGFIPK